MWKNEPASFLGSTSRPLTCASRGRTKEHFVLAEEFIVIDPASPLWNTSRPLLEAALRLEQQDEDHSAWHGWRKPTIEAFLRALPDHCTLLVGVWDGETGASVPERDVLVAGFVCEVRAGEVCTLRTLEALWTLAEAD